jgi:hypothetical protein
MIRNQMICTTGLKTFVRLNSDSASTEIQRNSADSKFFRSFALVLGVAVVVGIADGLIGLSVGAFVLFLFSVWRFFETRWKTTLLVYEYFIQLRQQTEPASGAAHDHG